VKSLQSQVDKFRSGEKYIKMRLAFDKQLAEKDKEIKALRQELEDAHRQTDTVKRYWLEGTSDLEREYARELQKKDSLIKEQEERALAAERKCDELQDKLKEKTRDFYRVGVELEDEKGRNKKLQSQINRDYENSSISSSLKPNHKKITNNREKTGKKPGGQPGHEGHGRKKQTPTNVIKIPAPKEYADSPDYKPTGRTITKQVVNISVRLGVDEYQTAEFRNVATGQRVHAQFPAGVVDDVSYGGSVKAFAFLLNNHCNVSIDKTRLFLSGLTGGALNISNGMINGLCKEFSDKTEATQKKAFADLLLSPVMNTDFTGAKVNGKGVQVIVCATPSTALYFAREHKGIEGVKGTPVEDYTMTLVHDHDKTFYRYGSAHQECLDHGLRYLGDSILNEPGLSWNERMRDLLREMIHYRNGLTDEKQLLPEIAEGFEKKYNEVLETAKAEYEYEPPGDYYKEGYNLYRRMDDYSESHLLFLHDFSVPTNNNLSERLLRIFKRKLKQMMTFRSFECLDYTCKSLSVIALLRAENKNLYSSISAIFG
jgi:hypothetical protein